jgi:cobalamin biosynthesis protein CbiG
MDKNKKDEMVKSEKSDVSIIENSGEVLFNKISELIEQSRRAICIQASGATVRMFWEIGRYITQ